MLITINNTEFSLEENSTLQDALQELPLSGTKGIALALNEEIIPKSEWQKVIVSAGDKIIIIGAVAGG
jgi:sulfur carrier protein